MKESLFLPLPLITWPSPASHGGTGRTQTYFCMLVFYGSTRDGFGVLVFIKNHLVTSARLIRRKKLLFSREKDL